MPTNTDSPKTSANLPTVESLWANQPIIKTQDDYYQSLKNRKLKIFSMGETVEDILSHPIIRPSINAVARTYKLAEENPDLATAKGLAGQAVNRFLHVAQSPQDLVMQNKMQRRLGQLTGTCFQRCVGMDAINSLHSVTFEIDEKHQTPYHRRFVDFVKKLQHHNLILGGAMTDTKGDRSKAPHQQSDKDQFVHISGSNDQGIFIRGAKAHQTGCINSHWLVVMPTMRLGPEDKDFAVVGALPVDSAGITFIYGRQSGDTRSIDGGIDAGNEMFAGQEAMVIFDDVFIPYDHVFMNGEFEFAALLVERFTAYHRRSYVCKTGLGDVLIGAAASVADYNGVAKPSHIKDKLVEMSHLNETIYAAGIASSHQAQKQKSGVYLNDEMLANVCKHNVTRFPYELGRLAQDLAGGLLATLPSEKDLNHPEAGPLLRKYLKAKDDIAVEDRMRILRLIENMTMGRNAVGYLTESMHGAGSPQAQRIQILRNMQVDFKKQLARVLAGCSDVESGQEVPEKGFFAKVFTEEK